jgi:hypothetical protein
MDRSAVGERETAAQPVLALRGVGPQLHERRRGEHRRAGEEGTARASQRDDPELPLEAPPAPPGAHASVATARNAAVIAALRIFTFTIRSPEQWQ